MSAEDYTQDEYDNAAYVLTSKYRQAVIEALDKGPAQPVTIAKEAGVKLTHVSRAIGELQERGYVMLLVDEETKKGRLYGLTDNGEHVANVVMDVIDR